MAIKNRRGPYNKFDPTKLLPGEWAVVLTGDPNASDGLACYMCFGAGVVKRMATYEDMVDNIAASSGEAVAAEIDRQCKAAIQACQTATSNAGSAASAANTAAGNANTAVNEANTAANGANSAATAANEAAQAAQSVIQGDLSSNTVTFATAAKQNLVSGETLGVLFGKLYRWIASLGTAASKNVANNLTTTAATSFVLDARQGAVLNTRIGLLKSLNTTNKGSLVGAVNEVHDKIIMKKETITGLGGGYIFLATPEGYTIMTAVNPDWANEYCVTGVSAYTNGYTILFFNKAVPTTATFSVNSFWYKTS